MAPVSNFTVIYDAQCGVCTSSVAWLRRQHAEPAMRFLASESEEAVRLVPHRPPNQMAIVSPSGEVLLGADGWIGCMQTIPRYRGLAKVAGWPAVKPFVKFGYGLIARNRRRISAMLGRKPDVCEIK
jgi:predicted DCC family thiol-disulfide oxidoreductase YuxK